MTAQEVDTCEYEGASYEVLGHVGEDFPTAESFGITAYAYSSGNRIGYIMRFAIEDNQLLLMEMSVGSLTEPPEINGVAPISNPPYNFYVYRDLHYFVPYTGSMLLVKDQIQEYKTHMGFQHAWSYATVLKLEFTTGMVAVTNDLSSEYAEQRERKAREMKYQAKKARKAKKRSS